MNERMNELMNKLGLWSKASMFEVATEQFHLYSHHSLQTTTLSSIRRHALDIYTHTHTLLTCVTEVHERFTNPVF